MSAATHTFTNDTVEWQDLLPTVQEPFNNDGFIGRIHEERSRVFAGVKFVLDQRLVGAAVTWGQLALEIFMYLRRVECYLLHVVCKPGPFKSFKVKLMLVPRSSSPPVVFRVWRSISSNGWDVVLAQYWLSTEP